MTMEVFFCAAPRQTQSATATLIS